MIQVYSIFMILHDTGIINIHDTTRCRYIQFSWYYMIIHDTTRCRYIQYSWYYKMQIYSIFMILHDANIFNIHDTTWCWHIQFSWRYMMQIYLIFMISYMMLHILPWYRCIRYSYYKIQIYSICMILQDADIFNIHDTAWYKYI